MQILAQLDKKAFFKVFNNHASKRKLKLVRGISALGDGHIYLIGACYFYLLNTNQSNLALCAMIIAFMLERPSYFILKNMFKRARPSQAIVVGFVKPSDQFSLPSGHSSAAWLFATVVTWYFPHLGFIYMFALAISVSRVMLGVHYPCDVILGALLGSSFAVVGFLSV